MKIIHRDKLKNVESTFAVGDLFETKVDAIVSSEQTDFVLSGNPKSISGQIWYRYRARPPANDGRHDGNPDNRVYRKFVRI